MNTNGSNPASKYPVLTLEKTLEIINLLKDGPDEGLRIKDISERLSIGKGTVHRILNTLLVHGYVEQGEGSKKYQLGWKFFEIGNIVPRQRNVSNIEPSILWELSNKYGETVNLSIRIHNKAAIIAKADPQKANFKIGPYLGEHEPLHATAIGKVLVSEMSEEELEKLLETLVMEKHTENTITSLPELKAELSKVRSQGYALDQEELSYGLTCIAMPVYSYNGEIIASMSISGPSFRMGDDKILSCQEGLQEACKQISTYFGANNNEQL